MIEASPWGDRSTAWKRKAGKSFWGRWPLPLQLNSSPKAHHPGFKPSQHGRLKGALVTFTYKSESVSCSVMSASDSLQPHGQKPTKLLCPWGFSSQEYWSGLRFPPPGDLPDPGIEPRSPALQTDLSEPPGKPIVTPEGGSKAKGSEPGIIPSLDL